MPVHVRKIRGLYRVVGPDDRIEKTKLGNARDGGGHRSKAKAHRQAAYINDSRGGRS